LWNLHGLVPVPGYCAFPHCFEIAVTSFPFSPSRPTSPAPHRICPLRHAASQSSQLPSPSSPPPTCPDGFSCPATNSHLCHFHAAVKPYCRQTVLSATTPSLSGRFTRKTLCLLRFLPFVSPGVPSGRSQCCAASMLSPTPFFSFFSPQPFTVCPSVTGVFPPSPPTISALRW